MRISMSAEFSVLKKNSEGVFVPMTKAQADGMCVGGFEFGIGDKSVPFDWNAFTGNEENGIFRFYTGKGFAFNDYDLTEDFDREYKKLGLKREEISASYLASAHHIEEFSVYFQDYPEFEDEYNEVILGDYRVNAESDTEYKLRLINVLFKDFDSGEAYAVASEVLASFNKGEKGPLALDKQIGLASEKSSCDADSYEMVEHAL